MRSRVTPNVCGSTALLFGQCHRRNTNSLENSIRLRKICVNNNNNRLSSTVMAREGGESGETRVNIIVIIAGQEGTVADKTFNVLKKKKKKTVRFAGKWRRSVFAAGGRQWFWHGVFGAYAVCYANGISPKETINSEKKKMQKKRIWVVLVERGSVYATIIENRNRRARPFSLYTPRIVRRIPRNRFITAIVGIRRTKTL